MHFIGKTKCVKKLSNSFLLTTFLFYGGRLLKTFNDFMNFFGSGTPLYFYGNKNWMYCK